MAEPTLKRNNMIKEPSLSGDVSRTSAGKRSALRFIVDTDGEGDTSATGGRKALPKPETTARERPTDSKGQDPVSANPGEKPFSSSKNGTKEGPEATKPVGTAQGYAQSKRTGAVNSRQGWRRTIGEAYREMERSAGQGRREGFVSDRTAGHFVRQMVNTPRYVKNMGGAGVLAHRNIRYLSKVHRDVKTGAITAKEARIATLRRGSDTLKEAGRAALLIIGRETSDFYGSDDLGVEAVRKPKDVIVNGYRTLKAASGVATSMSKAPAKARKAIRGSAQAAKKIATSTVTAARTVSKALGNPVVLKSVLIGVLVALAAVMLMAVVSSISSVFASFTLTSNDRELTRTYAWMTELDADLNQKMAKIEEEIFNIGVERFHYYLNGTPVGQQDMRVMTDTDCFLNYLDVKYKEYTLDGNLPFPETTVRNEVSAIHQQLYTVTRHDWEEKIPRTTEGVGPLGKPIAIPWTETVDHLDISMTTIPIDAYIEANRDSIFTKGQAEQYQALNEVGGMNLRQELGNPFPGYDWESNLSVTTRFGWRIHPLDGMKKHHDGIDIGQLEGTPIQAVMGGTVTEVLLSSEGYGNRVRIASGDRKNLYAHCKDVLVTTGQVIRRGDVIATVGNTGASTDPHLHLEYAKKGILMNPAFFVTSD